MPSKPALEGPLGPGGLRDAAWSRCPGGIGSGPERGPPPARCCVGWLGRLGPPLQWPSPAQLPPWCHRVHAAGHSQASSGWSSPVSEAPPTAAPGCPPRLRPR
eukprot:1295649-Alexandrium_andersonii.AAC.1